jgi:hypothetical protein
MAFFDRPDADGPIGWFAVNAKRFRARAGGG